VPFYPAFIGGMNLVLLAQDAFSFLVGWEFMSLASWALVVSEDRSESNRRAGLVYLIMAAGGALTLLLAFGVLAGPHGGYTFEQMRQTGTFGPASIVLILALIGAGSKAGLVPLHAWLPLAHPAAPSHVYALMSGVMTKWRYTDSCASSSTWPALRYGGGACPCSWLRASRRCSASCTH
jgi:formate hydrogenlyase subunit 3/multisubunit Na+/H+ antiporter MnhD subunit